MSRTAKAPVTIRGHNCFLMDNRAQGYLTTQGYDLGDFDKLGLFKRPNRRSI